MWMMLELLSKSACINKFSPVIYTTLKWAAPNVRFGWWFAKSSLETMYNHAPRRVFPVSRTSIWHLCNKPAIWIRAFPSMQNCEYDLHGANSTKQSAWVSTTTTDSIHSAGNDQPLQVEHQRTEKLENQLQGHQESRYTISEATKGTQTQPWQSAFPASKFSPGMSRPNKNKRITRTRRGYIYIYARNVEKRDVRLCSLMSGSSRTGYRWEYCRLHPSCRCTPTEASCVSSHAGLLVSSSAHWGNPGHRRASARGQPMWCL